MAIQLSGSLAMSGSIIATGEIIAQMLNVQQVTSSVIYSSGSNIFGNSLSNTQQFTGSVLVTGSLTVSGPISGTGPTQGTIVYGSTVACSPVGCFATSCATSFVGGTISGTTVYASTVACSPSILSSGTICSTGNNCFGGMSIVASCLGVGTATPNQKLQVYDATVARILVGTNTTFTDPYSAFPAQNISAIQVISSNVGGAQLQLGYTNTCSGCGIGGIHFMTTGTSASEKRGALIASELEASSATNVTANLVFYTNITGTIGERMRIASTGQVCFACTICAPMLLASGCVGIGTTLPAARLHVNGSIGSPTYKGFVYTYLGSETLTDEVLFQAVVNGYTSNVPLYLFKDQRTDQQTTQRIFEIQGGRSGVGTILTTLANGNVGIGTTDTQSFRLAVNGANVTQGDANTTVRIFDTTSATTGTGGGISFGGYFCGTSSVANTLAFIQGGKENSTADNFASFLRFGTRINGGDPTERMRITSAGIACFACQICSTTISATTEFRLGASFTRIATLDAGGSFGGGYNLNWNNGSPIHDSTGTISGYGYSNDGSIRLYTNSSQASNTAACERMRIISTGEVGIGVVPTAGNRFWIRGSSASSGDTSLFIQNSTPNALFLVRNDGNVGIGTTSFLNSSNVQVSTNSGNTNAVIFSVYNTAACPSTTAQAQIGLGFINGNTSYTPDGICLGEINYFGQGNNAGYGGASIKAILVSGGGNTSRTCPSVDLVLYTKPKGDTGVNERMRITGDGIACFACNVIANGDFNIRNTSFSTTGTLNKITWTNLYPSTYNVADIGVQLDGNYYNGAIIFRTADADNANVLVERMRMESRGVTCFRNTVCVPMLLASGCVGIGVTSPATTLHVAGEIIRTDTIRFRINQFAGGGCYNRQCFIITSAWAAASNRSQVEIAQNYGGIGWYILGAGNCNCYITYKLALNFTNWLCAQVRFANYADGSTRSARMQYSWDNGGTWNNLGVGATFGAGSDIAGGVVPLNNETCQTTGILSLRFGFCDGNGSSTLVGWDDILFIGCGKGMYIVNELG